MKTQQNNLQQNATPKTIAERIKNLRTRKGVTQEEAAETFNVEATTWNRYEKGNRGVPIWLLEQIGVKWGVTIDYLVKGTKDTNNVNLLDLSGLSPDDCHLLRDLADRLRRS